MTSASPVSRMLDAGRQRLGASAAAWIARRAPRRARRCRAGRASMVTCRDAVVAVDRGRALRRSRSSATVGERHGAARWRSATFRASIMPRSARARSSSCTRIGICRSPALNLARLASMSPMVATRIVSAMASVETPRSAATSVLRRDAHLRPVERRGRDDALKRSAAGASRSHAGGDVVDDA